MWCEVFSFLWKTQRSRSRPLSYSSEFMNYWTTVKDGGIFFLNSMRPLYHPSVQDLTVEGILYALSDPVRVRIFAAIAGSDCAKTCSNFLTVNDKKLPKSTLSQHFKVLREAGLIRSERVGVEMHNTTRCKEIAERFGNLIPTIVEAYRTAEKPAKAKRKK